MPSLRGRARWRAAVFVGVFVGVFALASPAGGRTSAQSVVEPSDSQPTSSESEPRTWRVGPLFGIARQSPGALFLGTTPGRDHLFVGVQAATPMRRRVGRATLAYTVQILPLVSITGRTAPIGYPGFVGSDGLLPGAARVSAFGFSPVGFELATSQQKRVSWLGEVAGGMLIFPRPFPVPEADRVNFTFEIGVGARVRTRTRQWLQLGYKLHHLSNAYRAEMNPGVDGHVLYAGYQWTARPDDER